MSTSWDKAKEMSNQHSSANAIFVRLANDGDKVVVAFVGDPYCREVIWTGERYERFDPDDLANTGKRASLRVAFNLFIPAEDGVKIFDGGLMFFNDVIKIREKYGLDEWLFEIERHGPPRDVKTVYSILPEEKIDNELRARIAAAELYDLESLDTGDIKTLPSNSPDESTPPTERKDQVK